MALSIVISSAYSRSEPTGMPTPIRVTRTPSGLISFETYTAVASPSAVGFVAIMISCTVPAFQPFNQSLQLQLIRPFSFQRRKRSAQHMIKTGILARALNGEDVVRLFDDADHSAITVGARAVKAGIGIGDVVTDAAFTNLQLGIANGVGQGHRVFWVGAEHMKGKALRRLLADPGQAFELID